MWTVIFWVLVGVAGAVAFSIALAYVLHLQRLHLQIHLLRKLVRRSRSPWAAEDAGWRRLGEAVKQIPEDVMPKKHD